MRGISAESRARAADTHELVLEGKRELRREMRVWFSGAGTILKMGSFHQKRGKQKPAHLVLILVQTKIPTNGKAKRRTKLKNHLPGATNAFVYSLCAKFGRGDVENDDHNENKKRSPRHRHHCGMRMVTSHPASSRICRMASRRGQMLDRFGPLGGHYEQCRRALLGFVV